MIWIIGFIVFLLVEVFGARTRSAVLLILGLSLFYIMLEEGYMTPVMMSVLLGLIVLSFFVATLVPSEEEKEKKEIETYGEILSKEDREFLRENGSEAYDLKRIRDGKTIMMSDAESERINQLGISKSAWIEEQREKRKTMGDEKWLEEQKGIYELEKERSKVKARERQSKQRFPVMY